MRNLILRIEAYLPYLLLVILCVGLVFVVFVTKSQQNTKSSAALDATCQSVPSILNEAAQSSNTSIAADNKEVVKKYKELKSNSFSQGSITKLRDIAQRRKKELIRIMQEDPEKAYSLILPKEDRATLASVTTDCVEQEKTIEGELQIVHYDFEDGRTTEIYTLQTTNNKKIQIFPAGKTIMLKNNMKLKATGYAIDNNLLVDTDNSSSVTILSSGINSDIADAQGQQNVAVLLEYFQNTAQPSMSAQTAGNNFFTDLNNYYKETSYNKTSVTGAATASWIQIPLQQTCDITSSTYLTAAINAASSSLDLSKYTRFVIYSPFGSCGWNGAGYIGRVKPLVIGGVSRNVSIAWINMSNYPGSISWLTRVVSHEFGHNLGVNHATMQNCNCSLPEYGDPFSVMGKNQYGGGDQVVQWNAPHREFIGWLGGTSVKTVTTNGTITLLPIESSSVGIKAIKIPRSSGNYLYAEYRQPIGVDSNISSINQSNAFNGALLHTIINSGSSIKTDLIDTTPLSSVPASAIQLGETYTDSGSQATITVTGKSPSALNLFVSFDGATPPPVNSPTPTNTPPPGITTTPTNSPTPTVSAEPTQTPTPSPTPFVCQPGSTTCKNIALTLFLHGIGLGGDNKNPTSVGNLNPNHAVRAVSTQVLDSSGNIIATTSGNITYNPINGNFTGTIALGDIPTGQPLTIKVRSDKYLKKLIPGIWTFNSSTTTTLPPTTLVLGDINGDNSLDILDYNLLITCYAGVSGIGCDNASETIMSDLDDDGVVDQVDYNLFLRELQTQNGD